MEVIEEEGGAVGVVANKEKAKGVRGEEMDGNLDDEDADGEEEGSEKGDEVIDTGWEDVYEQEV
jgi:transcription factor IIIB 90 kDa subunit